MSGDVIIRVETVTTYSNDGKVKALDGVSTEIRRGEAVVINEKFGVRLTDIISPIERVKQLG